MNLARKIKRRMKECRSRDNIIYCLQDMDEVFSSHLLEAITDLHEEGYQVHTIANAINRDPDEVFIALFHQARQGKITRAIGCLFPESEGE